MALITQNKNYLFKFFYEKNNNYYLSYQNKEKRKHITKFRLSDHQLLVEKGRYLKIPREERKCQTCNILDDEKHFFFDCKLNQNIRNDFTKYYLDLYDNFRDLNYIEKLKIILNPSKSEDIFKAVSFIKQSFELRRGDS